MKATAVLICIVFVTLLTIAECQQRSGYPGGRMRCPNGRPGYRTCSGWVPNSCGFGYYCHAPADAGVCCRTRGGGGTGQCPPPRRWMCRRGGMFGHSRRCRSDWDCPGWSNKCCFDGCTRKCTRVYRRGRGGRND